MHIVNPEVISELTAIRISNYDMFKIQQACYPENVNNIFNLILGLHKKILKANSSETDSKATHIYFIKIVRNLRERDEAQMFYFAAQLLQYCTVLSNKEFLPKSQFKEFQKFQTKNSHYFGDISNNLLLLEYQLIKIYNDLFHFMDSNLLPEPKLTHTMFQNKIPGDLELIQKHLIKSQKSIELLKQQSINNVFIHYLYFVVNYILAKFSSCKLKVNQSKYNQHFPLELFNEQKKYLHEAKKALEDIMKYTSDTEQHETSSVGIEYCLGHNLFFQFPEKNIMNIIQHIDELLINS